MVGTFGCQPPPMILLGRRLRAPPHWIVRFRGSSAPPDFQRFWEQFRSFCQKLHPCPVQLETVGSHPTFTRGPSWQQLGGSLKAYKPLESLVLGKGKVLPSVLALVCWSEQHFVARSFCHSQKVSRSWLIFNMWKERDAHIHNLTCY